MKRSLTAAALALIALAASACGADETRQAPEAPPACATPAPSSPAANSPPATPESCPATQDAVEGDTAADIPDCDRGDLAEGDRDCRHRTRKPTTTSRNRTPTHKPTRRGNR